MGGPPLAPALSTLALVAPLMLAGPSMFGTHWGSDPVLLSLSHPRPGFPSVLPSIGEMGACLCQDPARLAGLPLNRCYGNTTSP